MKNSAWYRESQNDPDGGTVAIVGRMNDPHGLAARFIATKYTCVRFRVRSVRKTMEGWGYVYLGEW